MLVNTGNIHRMRVFRYIVLIMVLVGVLGVESGTVFSQGNPIPSGDLSPKAIQDSINGGISYLREKQLKDGSWAEYPGYSPGSTALCTLSLLSSGLDKDDPTVAKALVALRRSMPETEFQTYPISLQTMVFCLADPQRDQALIRRNVDWLIERQFKTNNVFNGGWAYVGSQQQYDQVDNSNSQFAILALFEAQRVGIEIPESVWDSALQYWLRMQNPDGSWGYRASVRQLQENNSGSGTGSMTCAGIGALVICAGAKSGINAKVESDKIECCQDADDTIGKCIDRGLAWMSRHFSVQNNPGTDVSLETWIFYYLYGLERVGRLTAHRFIGKNDWYREGAAFLLRRKGVFTKYWRAQIDLKGNHCVATAFALLFLSKGRRPVLVSKLRYGTDDSWNLHANDMLHLTEYTEKLWNQPLIWQMIDSDKATVDDLLQTPVLYMSGIRSPIPTDLDRKRRLVQALRGYLEQGGFIFAEALDGDESFEQGFTALMKEVLPGEGNSLILIEPNHPIWQAEKVIPPELLRPVYGIDFGCRTSVVFVPAYRPKTANGPPSVFDDRPSLSCLWELAVQSGPRPQYSEAVEKQISAGLNLGVNVLAYATNREMKFKEEMPESLAKEISRGGTNAQAIHVALLEHSGGCSCAPRAVPHLLRTLKQECGIDFDSIVPQISATSKELYGHPIIFMHGRNAFHFTQEERQNLRNYFERGGFLFANAICASKQFAQAFEEEIKNIFPSEKFVDIPLDDPIYTERYGGFRIQQLELRLATRHEGRKIESAIAPSPPQLRGIKKDDRWIVVYSPYDVSCALERSTAIECSGYSQKSAFQLASNILLYAIEHL